LNLLKENLERAICGDERFIHNAQLCEARVTFNTHRIRLVDLPPLEISSSVMTRLSNSVKRNSLGRARKLSQ
jgi:hypothetical protein